MLIAALYADAAENETVEQMTESYSNEMNEDVAFSQLSVKDQSNLLPIEAVRAVEDISCGAQRTVATLSPQHAVVLPSSEQDTQNSACLQLAPTGLPNSRLQMNGSPVYQSEQSKPVTVPTTSNSCPQVPPEPLPPVSGTSDSVNLESIREDEVDAESFASE